MKFGLPMELAWTSWSMNCAMHSSARTIPRPTERATARKLKRSSGNNRMKKHSAGFPFAPPLKAATTRVDHSVGLRDRGSEAPGAPWSNATRWTLDNAS